MNKAKIKLKDDSVHYIIFSDTIELRDTLDSMGIQENDIILIEVS